LIAIGRHTSDSNRKVGNLGSTPDAVERPLSLVKTLYAVSHLGLSNLTVVVAQPDKRHAKKELLGWRGMTDTEHSAISGSN